MQWLLLALVLAQADDAADSSQWTRSQLEAWIEKTDKETKRLSPSEFHDLPAAIQSDLIERNCTIPQAGSNPRPHNVISGHFQVPGRKDWAVLCSIDRMSRILMYKGGDVRSLYEKPDSASPDRDWVQGGIGFSRSIGAADSKTITRYNLEFAGPELPPIDHQGLAEMYVGKASTIYYWHDGSWLELQGAD